MYGYILWREGKNKMPVDGRKEATGYFNCQSTLLPRTWEERLQRLYMRGSGVVWHGMAWYMWLLGPMAHTDSTGVPKSDIRNAGINAEKQADSHSERSLNLR